MRISVVVPAYNEEQFIRSCLDAVVGALRTRVSSEGAVAVAAYPPEVFLDRLVASYDRVR